MNMLSFLFILSAVAYYSCFITTATNITNSSVATTETPSIFPSISPSKRPTISPSEPPTISPSAEPTISPSPKPTVSPSIKPTESPLNVYNYTTTIGPNIDATQRLEVNFTLNFSTETASASVESVNDSLNVAYGLIGIPVNYVHNIVHVQFINHLSYYFCKIFSSIDAKDKKNAYLYQEQINSDPDDSTSAFVTYLKQTLRVSPNSDSFDISILIMDIVPIEENKDSHNDDTASIIIWFLGVSAVCAVSALLLIICWRKFSAKDDNELKENENAIDLEFLLADPAATMHIAKNAEAEEETGDNDDDNDGKEKEEEQQQPQQQEEEEEERIYEAPNLDRI